MTKKICEVLALAGAVFVLSGCQYSDAIGNALYDPVTSTNLVDTSTGSVAVVSTNGWVLKPSIQTGVSLAGDVAPFPWAGLVANGVLAALGVGAHLKGRRWRQAALSGVHAAQIFKSELQNLDIGKAKTAKRRVVDEQKTRGTQSLIQNLLRNIV